MGNNGHWQPRFVGIMESTVYILWNIFDDNVLMNQFDDNRPNETKNSLLRGEKNPNDWSKALVFIQKGSLNERMNE